MTQNPQIWREISGPKAFQLFLEPTYLKSSKNWYLVSRYCGRNIWPTTADDTKWKIKVPPYGWAFHLFGGPTALILKSNWTAPFHIPNDWCVFDAFLVFDWCLLGAWCLFFHDLVCCALATCLLRACCVLASCLLRACCMLDVCLMRWCVAAACLLRAYCVLAVRLLRSCYVLAACLLRAGCMLSLASYPPYPLPLFTPSPYHSFTN